MKFKDVKTLESILLEYGMKPGSSTSVSQQQSGASAKANANIKGTAIKRFLKVFFPLLFINQFLAVLKKYGTAQAMQQSTLNLVRLPKPDQ